MPSDKRSWFLRRLRHVDGLGWAEVGVAALLVVGVAILGLRQIL
ncbi:MAG: hypothetical protein AAF321_02260 [Pseudomonadota bacterium]